MVDLSNFSTQGIEIKSQNEPLPAGRYLVQMVDSQLKDTKSGGKQLAATFDVLEGAAKGRKIFERYSLTCPPKTRAPKDIENAKLAERMGAEGMTKLSRAVFGEDRSPRNSAEWHGKPFYVDLAVKQGSGDYGPSNTIKKYYTISGVPAEKITPVPASQSVAATQAAPSLPSTGSVTFAESEFGDDDIPF